jgi:UDP:flavonoid glycosyltransferase YjiC (YdhE family)
VLITLGTSFADDPNFFLAAAQAADRLGCLPVLALGRTPSPATAPWLARLPASAVTRALVAFDAVLPYAAAAIHHGGAGTTHALVTHGVPQIVVPHAADQVHQAQGVMRSGVGLHLPPKQATVAALTQALAALRPDLADHRRRAQALQAEFAQLGGVPTAADWLERSAS